jgi:hypothetical protein
MIALHKPTALPDYLPLIEGVTTRHSLSPALLDPFDPEEVCVSWSLRGRVLNVSL